MIHENNLYALRLSKHLTQREFAEEAAINAGVYSRYERGETDIPLSVAKRIAEAFDTSIDYIAGLTDGIDYETIAENQKEDDIRQIKEQISDLTERMEILENK